MTESLTKRRNRYHGCSTRSNTCLCGGWSIMLRLYLLNLLVGGSSHLTVWTLINCVALFSFIIVFVFNGHWWAVFVSELFEGEKNTSGGGSIVFSFSSPKTEITVQNLIEFSFWSSVQSLNAADKGRERERENKDTKKLYMFLPQTESSPVPLALPRRVH